MSANAQRVFNVPKSSSKLIPLAIGLVIIIGVTVGIYFGVIRLKGESKEKAVNDAGTTPASAPGVPADQLRQPLQQSVQPRRIPPYPPLPTSLHGRPPTLIL